MIISKNAIARGIRNGSIELVKSPHGDGVVCNIGEHWFYFGGKEAEDYGDPEQYIGDMGIRKVVNQIFEALEDIKDWKEDGDKYSDEWLYYAFYLQEYLIKHNNNEIRKILKKYDLE